MYFSFYRWIFISDDTENNRCAYLRSISDCDNHIELRVLKNTTIQTSKKIAHSENSPNYRSRHNVIKIIQQKFITHFFKNIIIRHRFLKIPYCVPRYEEIHEQYNNSKHRKSIIHAERTRAKQRKTRILRHEQHSYHKNSKPNAHKVKQSLRNILPFQIISNHKYHIHTKACVV